MSLIRKLEVGGNCVGERGLKTNNLLYSSINVLFPISFQYFYSPTSMTCGRDNDIIPEELITGEWGGKKARSSRVNI